MFKLLSLDSCPITKERKTRTEHKTKAEDMRCVADYAPTKDRLFLQVVVEESTAVRKTGMKPREAFIGRGKNENLMMNAHLPSRWLVQRCIDITIWRKCAHHSLIFWK